FTACLFMRCTPERQLIHNGHSDYKIIVAENAPEPAQRAARELQYYLEKIGGVKIPLVHETDDQETYIYIGFEGAPSSFDVDPVSFPNEHYILKSNGKSLLIAGGGSRGTLSGVIGYLSDHLACRWYTKDVHRIPTQKTIKLPRFEER